MSLLPKNAATLTVAPTDSVRRRFWWSRAMCGHYAVARFVRIQHDDPQFAWMDDPPAPGRFKGLVCRDCGHVINEWSVK